MDIKFLAERYILGQHNGWYVQRQYEPRIQKVCKKIHGELFVDIGAHRLFYSNRFAKNFNEVVAFEPNRNLDLHPKKNVVLFRTALSNRVGKEDFYCYSNGGNDGLIKGFDYDVPQRTYALAVKGPFTEVIDSFPVTVTTYDHVIREIADLVKIDVEGEEFNVLDGMRKNPPQNLIVELHDVKRESELISLMNGRGYSAWKLDPSHYHFK